MLLLSRSDIASLLTFDDYVQAVENAFRLHAEGATLEPALAHVDADGGEFHIKAGGMRGATPYFAVKVNGGFFQNRARFNMPNIQGLIVLSRADNGLPLAAMDSIEITIQRTGATTAVAAKYLAPEDARVATICGCGNQGRVQLRGLYHVRKLERVFCWDQSQDGAAAFAQEMSEKLGVPITPVSDLSTAVPQSQVCITCTPAKKPYLRREWVTPGTFIAAVGSDSPDKQELFADLTASARVVADLRAQVVNVGETHHAVAQGLMSASQIYAELGEVIAGRVSARPAADKITIFDSTGTALQDVAAAAVAYERAKAAGKGVEWSPV